MLAYPSLAGPSLACIPPQTALRLCLRMVHACRPHLGGFATDGSDDLSVFFYGFMEAYVLLHSKMMYRSHSKFTMHKCRSPLYRLSLLFLNEAFSFIPCIPRCCVNTKAALLFLYNRLQHVQYLLPVAHFMCRFCIFSQFFIIPGTSESCTDLFNGEGIEPYQFPQCVDKRAQHCDGMHCDLTASTNLFCRVMHRHPVAVRTDTQRNAVCENTDYRIQVLSPGFISDNFRHYAPVTHKR